MLTPVADIIKAMLDATAIAADVSQKMGLSAGQPVYVLSPHLDDAVWSLGAVLQALSTTGHAITVVTVFSTTTQTAVRKKEDMAALDAIGCKSVRLDFSDAILDGRSLQEVFNETYVPAKDDVAAIASSVQQTTPQDAVVLAPSGFGAHVDHLATRAVAAKLAARVVYYEDLPYAARDVRLAPAQTFFSSLGLWRHAFATTPTLVQEQIRLYELYTSQRQDHHVQQISSYLHKAGFGLWF